VLVWGERGADCDAGHHFDRARTGYVNLLQPQDRRAREPGDARAVVAARRRTVDRGLQVALGEALGAEIAGLEDAAAGRPILDAGCGEGFALRVLGDRTGARRWGVDISVAAVEAAAGRDRAARFVVANADRALPFAGGSFGAILSVTGPKNALEFARLLAPSGRLVVVVSGPDDLRELRAAVQGGVLEKDRMARMVERFAPGFLLERCTDVRSVARLDRPALEDLLSGSYRGVRYRARERFAAVAVLEVTLSWRVLSFRPAL
jgi:23S rRNA (guanine745-N1)-methyltransferase